MNRTHWIVVGALVAGFFLVLFGGWHFVIKPLEQDYADQIAKKEDLSKQLQVARDTAAQFVKFKAQAENMRRNLEFYRTRTDSNLSLLAVNQLVTSIGNENDLKDFSVDVSLEPGSAPGGGTLYKASCNFESDFDHFGRFLNACLSQRRIIVPAGTNIAAYEDGTGEYFNSVTVSIALKVYAGPVAK